MKDCVLLSCEKTERTTQVEVTNLWGVSYLDERLTVTVMWEDLGSNIYWDILSWKSADPILVKDLVLL